MRCTRIVDVRSDRCIFEGDVPWPETGSPVCRYVYANGDLCHDAADPITVQEGRVVDKLSASNPFPIDDGREWPGPRAFDRALVGTTD